MRGPSFFLMFVIFLSMCSIRTVAIVAENVSKMNIVKSRSSSVAQTAERGAAMIMFTMMTAVVLIPLIGLAIDGSIMYWEKAKLSAAVDAAALAVGRALNTNSNQTLDSQIPAAKAIGQSYFTANFPPGAMGASVVGGSADITVDTSQSAVITIQVQANVSVPLYFMRLLGHPTATLSNVGQAKRRDVNVILILDLSTSMATANTCTPMKTAAQNFVNRFVAGRDTLELITFDTSARVKSPYTDSTTSFQTLNTKIGGLSCAGYTNSPMALSLAYSEIKTVLPGANNKQNVIVFFTDGYPTAFYLDTYPTKGEIKAKDTRYPVGAQTESTVAASTCSSSVVLSGIFYAANSSPTTTTNGIATSTATGTSPSLITATGCKFYANGASHMREDVAYFPSTDHYGNSTTDNGYKPLILFTNNLMHPAYNNTIRPDIPQNLVNIAYNTADSAARRIRSDTTYRTVIYSIGLDNGIDSDFMRRVANDPLDTTGSYDSSQPAGFYVYARTASDLNPAFQQIASQILHISQ